MNELKITVEYRFIIFYYLFSISLSHLHHREPLIGFQVSNLLAVMFGEIRCMHFNTSLAGFNIQQQTATVYSSLEYLTLYYRVFQ